MSKKREAREKKRDRLTLNLDIAQSGMDAENARAELKAIAAMCGFTWGADGSISQFMTALLKLSPKQKQDLMRIFRKGVED